MEWAEIHFDSDFIWWEDLEALLSYMRCQTGTHSGEVCITRLMMLRRSYG